MCPYHVESDPGYSHFRCIITSLKEIFNLSSTHQTAYPRLKSSVSEKELNEIYTPTADELALASVDLASGQRYVTKAHSLPVQAAGLLLSDATH
jgi:hypothetical protein